MHLALVDRILPTLPKRLADKEDYIRAGAFYPDAFYDCMSKSNAAEEAHWPPFLAKGVQLVKERRQRGMNTDSLEAFLLGIMTHQIADISWHSLGINQGLLRAMVDSEFNGDYDSAHSILDIGGDMIFLSRLLPQEVQEVTRSWKYNNNDIKTILQMVGYSTISNNEIKYCMGRGRAALTAEKKVSSIGYKRFARRSPMMFNELETYFAGGLTDITDQLEECIPRFNAWVNGDLNLKSPWDLCQVFKVKKPNEQNVNFEKRYMGASTLEVLKDISQGCKKKVQKVKPKQLENSYIIPAPALIPDSHDSVGTLHRPDFSRKIVFWNGNLAVSAPGEGFVYIYDEHLELSFKIKSPEPLKHKGKFATGFGDEMAIWQGYLVISSPGLSQLDFYDASGEWNGGIKWEGSVKEYGARGPKLIGSTLAVDEDFGEMYVGAPSFDSDLADQVGAVFLLPKHILLSVVKTKDYKTLPISCYLIHQGVEPYEQVGKKIAMSPRVALVGSPGQSKVHGLDYSTHKKILFLKDPSFQNDKPAGYGGNLLLGNKDYIVVGAPAKSRLPPKDGYCSTSGNDESSITQRGLISIYKNNKVHHIWGDGEFTWLGTNGVLIGNTAYISSPYAYESNGMIWKLDLRNQELEEVGSPINSFSSGLGASIATNGSLVVFGMPYYKNSYQDRLGAIAIMNVDQDNDQFCAIFKKKDQQRRDSGGDIISYGIDSDSDYRSTMDVHPGPDYPNHREDLQYDARNKNPFNRETGENRYENYEIGRSFNPEKGHRFDRVGNRDYNQRNGH